VTSAKTMILGAGPTGLSAAFHSDKDTLLVERENRVGGCCRSIYLDGFTFDLAGHIMFSNDPYVHELYTLLLRDNVHWQEREAWVYSKGVHTRYPFHGALHGLPMPVIQECLVGAIEARFGVLKSQQALPHAPLAAQASHLVSRAIAQNGNGTFTPRLGAGENGAGRLESRLAASQNGSGAHASSNGHHANGHHANGHHPPGTNGRGATNRMGAATEPANFEEFIHRVWGAGIARHFAIPYNRKLWAVPLTEMETSWLGGRVPLPDLEEMIEGALASVPKPTGPDARFGYPLRGGFQALMDAFLPYIKGHLRLNTTVVGISPSRREVRFHDGTGAHYETLISTMPLPRLVALLHDEAPAHVREAAAGLRHVSVRCVNIGVGRERITDKHWIHYPEDPVFHRLFVQGNASPHCNPPGGFGLTCEITYSDSKPLPAEGENLILRCVEDCRRVGIMREDDSVRIACQADLPYAYVVCDHSRRERVDAIREWLRDQDILLAGPFSEWEYYNSDHAFIAGRDAALAADQTDASSLAPFSARSARSTDRWQRSSFSQ